MSNGGKYWESLLRAPSHAQTQRTSLALLCLGRAYNYEGGTSGLVCMTNCMTKAVNDHPLNGRAFVCRIGQNNFMSIVLVIGINCLKWPATVPLLRMFFYDDDGRRHC